MNNLPKKNLLLFIILVFVLLYTSISIFKNRHRNSEIHHADDLSWVQTSKGFLHIQTYKNITSIDSINLFVIIHGDAPFEKPDYQYRMAQKIASDNRNSVAVGILRPGYTDPANNTSNGIKGFTTGDNYTLEVIQAIAETIELLKNKYKPAKIILIGHSGGAAIAGDIIGMRPQLVNTAFLVSCPCDLPKWRKHMSNKQLFNPGWLFDVRSISPLSVVENIDPKTEVIVMVGEKDEVTPTELSLEYYNKLKSNNKRSKIIVIPDLGHEILLHKTILEQIKSVLP